MKNCLGRFLVVPGSLGVPQHALAQSWKVAQSKYRKSSFRCRIDSWSADVSFTDHSWLEHRARQASSRKSLAVGLVQIIRRNHHHRHHHRHLRGNSLAEKKVFAGLFFAGIRHNHHHRHQHHHHPQRHLRGNSLAEGKVIAGITHRRISRSSSPSSQSSSRAKPRGRKGDKTKSPRIQ